MTTPPRSEAPARNARRSGVRAAQTASADPAGGLPSDAAWRDGLAVVEALASDAEAGLTRAEAQRRLTTVGGNELEDEPRRPPWQRLLAQFANAMIIVLIVAAAITVAVGEWRDAAVIAAILVLNAAIGFVQESRAEEAMAALKSMAAPTARVVRDGDATAVAARELVPGDLLLLEAGDVVPADARLLACPGLRVDEAPLTGESTPVDKSASPLPPDADRALSNQTNMVFKGSAVVHGRARAVVVATGMETALGGIAGLLRSHQAPRTPLQRRLGVLGRRLAAAAVVVCTIVFALGMLRGEDPAVMFLTAVSLAVAAIPEALPAVVTISLALGAQRMARHRALMRTLPAVETLGSVTVICSDKTGTLTQGRMQVELVWTPEGEVTVTGSGYDPAGELLGSDGPIVPAARPTLLRLLRVAALCNDASLRPPDADGDGSGHGDGQRNGHGDGQRTDDGGGQRAGHGDGQRTDDGDGQRAGDGDGNGWTITGDPTEGALAVLAVKAGVVEPGREHPRVDELAFDADRKRMTTLHRGPDGDGLVATKGGVEAVLEVSSTLAAVTGDVPLTEGERRRILDRTEDYAARGYRVLALAGRAIAAGVGTPDLEQELTFYGLTAMADPPRPESMAAVEACRRAGIKPVMITGDHPATAAAIAARMGIDHDGRLLTGAELAVQGAEGLAAHVDRIDVYARTTPEQKLDIVEAWQARGEIVAMTGDGVNDAPALRRADIGVAMGVTGTEVAKEAAAMVLADDDFATIVTAVGEGRRIYDNIQRFVRYTLTSNTGEIWVMLLGPFLGLPLPLLAVQILMINLVTDGLPGLALGVEPAERDVMRRPPRPPDASVFARGMWQHILLVGLLMGAVPLGLGVWASATGRPWQTMVFTSLALLQLGHALGVRSERDSLLRLGLTSNRPLLVAVVGSVAVQLAVVYTAWGQTLFHTEALAALELAIVLLASTIVLLVVEAEKAVRRRLDRSASG
jgi:P-type Ca2+ transporter type 2C